MKKNENKPVVEHNVPAVNCAKIAKTLPGWSSICWDGFPTPSQLLKTKGACSSNPLEVSPAQAIMMVERYASTHAVLWVVVTPAVAGAILEHLNLSNRNEKPLLQEDMIADMLADNFVTMSTTIKFTRGKKLAIDGQNRLQSVCGSGVSQVMAFCYGEPEEAILYVDANCAVRTVRDQVKIMTGTWVRKELTSMARHMYEYSPLFGGVGKGPRGTRDMTTSEAARACDEHIVNLMRANRLFLDNGNTICATAKAVLARAYYTQAIPVVDRFCELATLNDTNFDPPMYAYEMAVARLVATVGKLARSRSESNYLTIYRLMEMGLKNFIMKKAPGRLVEATSELFALPRSVLTSSMEGARVVVVPQKRVDAKKTVAKQVVAKQSELAK